MIVQWSEEDQLFLVTISEFTARFVIPCTRGKTRSEAICNDEEVIEMYLEACLTEGESIPEPITQLIDISKLLSQLQLVERA